MLSRESAAAVTTPDETAYASHNQEQYGVAISRLFAQFGDAHPGLTPSEGTGQPVLLSNTSVYAEALEIAIWTRVTRERGGHDCAVPVPRQAPRVRSSATERSKPIIAAL